MPGYKYFEDYTIGQKQTTSGRTMTEADIRLFIGCSDNTHPVHVDAQYCERHPSVTGCILQGDLILGVADGFFAKEITPSKVPSIHYGMDKVRFVKPTYPGDTVHCETEVVGQDIKNEQFGVITWNVNVLNQRGETVIFYVDKQYIGRRSAFSTPNEPKDEE